MSTTRRPIAAGNWKMNLLSADAEAFCTALQPRLGGGSEVILFPSFPLLPAVAAGLAGAAAAWGGQDLHPEDAGAHTGDVSGSQLADAGCTWALCGHSERRQGHGEDDARVAAKIGAALRHRLRPMVCIGETREQRRAGKTLAVLERQLGAALDAVVAGAGDDLDPATGLALAYEPVWAIGSGETATPETAQEVHASLRRSVARRLGEAAADRLRILYGGSVKPGNAAELLAEPDLDGFLIGGASLDPASFSDIIAVCDRGADSR